MAYDFVEVGELSDKIQQDQKGGASIHFTEVDGRSIYKIGDKPIILLELAPGKHKIYLEDQHPKKQVATRHGARAIEVDIEPGGGICSPLYRKGRGNRYREGRWVTVFKNKLGSHSTSSQLQVR